MSEVWLWRVFRQNVFLSAPNTSKSSICSEMAPDQKGILLSQFETISIIKLFGDSF